MIQVHGELSGFDPADGKRVPHFHIVNIIKLLNMIDTARCKIKDKALKPGGGATSWEQAHEMQSILESAYGHTLRLQEIIQEKDEPDNEIATKCPACEDSGCGVCFQHAKASWEHHAVKKFEKIQNESKTTDEAAKAHFTDLYNRLGTTKDPAERDKIASEMARIIFGC